MTKQADKFEAIKAARSAWEATLPEERRSFRESNASLRAAVTSTLGEASAPDLERVRRALEIHDSVEADDWDMAWEFSALFKDAANAIDWIRAGWTDARAAAAAARLAGSLKKSGAILKKRKLTIRDVENWEQDVRDFPWKDDDWNEQARQLVAALAARWKNDVP